MAHARKVTQSRRTAKAAHRKTTTRRRTTTSRTTSKTASSRTSRSKTSKASRSKASKTSTARRASPRRWSQRVTKESDALDLKGGVFKQTSPKKIASSLKRSAEHSSRRKAGAYRSALSMLTFYINRAGKTLPRTQRTRLERAKVELKRAFGRE